MQHWPDTSARFWNPISCNLSITILEMSGIWKHNKTKRHKIQRVFNFHPLHSGKVLVFSEGLVTLRQASWIHNLTYYSKTNTHLELVKQWSHRRIQCQFITIATALYSVGTCSCNWSTSAAINTSCLVDRSVGPPLSLSASWEVRLDVEEAELGSGLMASLVVSEGEVLVKTWRDAERQESIWLLVKL